MTAAPILEARRLEKVYKHDGRDIAVLSGIDLDIMPGETLAVVGQSGAGKSTLLHVLGTLDTPSGGEVRYSGVNVFELDAKLSLQIFAIAPSGLCSSSITFSRNSPRSKM